VSEQYRRFHDWTPVSETGQAFHQGRPELRGRHDLAVPIYLGTDKGVPVILWSRRHEDHRFGRGDTIQGLLDSAPWGVARNGVTVRYFKDWR
jgi:hypothetical protein